MNSLIEKRNNSARSIRLTLLNRPQTAVDSLSEKRALKLKMLDVENETMLREAFQLL